MPGSNRFVCQDRIFAYPVAPQTCHQVAVCRKRLDKRRVLTFCVFSNVSRNRCCRNFSGEHRMSSVRRRRIESFELAQNVAYPMV